MAKLTAEPDLILVDLGQTDTTDITYEKLESDVLWHRYGPGNQNDWFEALPPSQTQQLKAEDEKTARTGPWTFTSPPVPPGSLYQVKVMRRGADPNLTLPEGVEAEVDVPCLLREPQVRVFITDEAGPEVGGTFVWHKIVTTDTPTLKRLSVGLSEPRPSNGILKFREVLAETPVPTEITTEQELEVTGLLPGNKHFALVLVSDRKGNWQQRDYEFTTLQREVTIRFTKLDITNDGDPNASSNADIHLEILSSETKNGVGRHQTEASFNFPVKNVNSGNTVKLINTHKMGPERVMRDNQFVLVNVSGVEEDGWFESDETAANFFGDALLNFPQGRGLEKVTKFPKSIWARPQNDDFNFYVHLDYDVKYTKP